MRISLATGRTATRLLGRHQRLDSSNKGAHELFIHLGRDRVNVDTLGGKKLARILHPVNTGRFNLDLFETRRCQFFAIFGLLQRLTLPKTECSGESWRKSRPGDDVRYCESSARLEHPEGFPQNPIFIGREIDNAVRND
jgi:hypothetical protein